MPRVEVCSGSGGGHNEDFVAVHENGSVTDMFVLDGATSVADRNYLDDEQGDVSWFVQTFAAELANLIDPSTSQGASVMRAAAATRNVWHRRTEMTQPPAYARPLAALTWLRAVRSAESATIHLYSLGDCTTLLRTPDGAVRDLDPWTNPQEEVLKREISSMLAEGLSDPAQRWARLLPLLRRRREKQNSAEAPSIVCLNPGDGFSARQTVLRLERGSTLLCMTDGFFRLVDPYQLYSPKQLVEACSVRGLKALLSELRDAENSAVAKGVSVKAADDASAVMWIA